MVKKLPTNNKGKALGSGTISNARRAKRAAQFGEPWSSSSSSWWQATDWAQDAADADEPASPRHWPASSSQWQQAPANAPAEAARQTPLARKAPVTPPWKKADSDEEEVLAKAEPPDEDPPTPWKLLDTVMSEPKSSSSSDDWGKIWKGAHKVRPATEEESLVFEEPLFEPSAPSRVDPAVEAQAAAMRRVLYPKVMVDWHNCLEVRGQVDEVSLKKLLDAGVDVTILSWCYKNRSREVMGLAHALADAHRLTRIETTEFRTKENGKKDLCQSWAIDVMFDDAQDILQEAFKAGMHVYPICTKWENHTWYRKLGFDPYPSFAHAVTAFLETYS